MLDSNRALPESTLCTEKLHSECWGFFARSPPSPAGHGHCGCIWGVVPRTGCGKISPACKLWDLRVFCWPSPGWESQKLRFLFKENPKHILRKRRTIFDQARVSHFFWDILCVFYITTEQKWLQGQSNFPFKNVSVWCFTKSKMQAGSKKENNPQSLLWLCLEELTFILLKVPALPQVQSCSFSVQQFFRAALQGTSAREAGYFYAGVLTKDSYFCMYAQT